MTLRARIASILAPIKAAEVRTVDLRIVASAQVLALGKCGFSAAQVAALRPADDCRVCGFARRHGNGTCAFCGCTNPD